MKVLLPAFFLIAAFGTARTHKSYAHKYAQISNTTFYRRQLRMEGAIALSASDTRQVVFACDTSDSTCLEPVLNTSYLLEDNDHYKCKNAYALNPVDDENGNKIPVCVVSVK